MKVLSGKKTFVKVRDREEKFEELKPLVPQFVADWYEEHKDDFEKNIFELCLEFRNCSLDN